MFEYKICPAPVKGQKAKGLKTAEERFANALEVAMNEMAGEGWEYVRAETLPAEERVGLTSKVTRFHNVLVFRRPIAETAPASATIPQPVAEPEPVVTEVAAPPKEAVAKTETRPAKAAQELAKKDSAEHEAPRPRGEMIGILRTIKGDHVTAPTGSGTSAASAGRD